MASYNRYIGDGSTTEFVVNFDLGFLSRTHVHVEVDQVPVEFTWLSDGLVDITPAPESDALVVIYRRSPQDAPVHSFKDSSILIESNIDEQNIHALMRAQEAEDINNIGESTLEESLEEARQYAEDAGESAQEAEDAAYIAVAARNNAAASASTALDAAERAEASADEAKNFVRTSTVNTMRTLDVGVGEVVVTRGYNVEYDQGFGTYDIVTLASFGGTPDEYGDFTLDNGLVARLRKGTYVYAVQYGVVPSATTDNSAALQAATNTTLPVKLPTGVIGINATIDVKSNLVGTDDTSLRRLNGTGAINLLRINAQSGLTFTDMFVDGNADNAAGGYTNVQVNDSYHLKFIGGGSIGAKGHGISLTDCDGVTVQAMRFTDTTEVGLEVRSSSNILVTSNTFSGGVHGVSLTRNVNNNRNVVITGNTMTGLTGSGIHIPRDVATSVPYSLDVNVSQNIVKLCGSNGYLIQCNRGTIVGNIAHSNGTGTIHQGFVVNGTDISMTGNVSEFNTGVGIDFGNVIDGVVADNVIRGNGIIGLEINSCTNVIASGNLIRNNYTSNPGFSKQIGLTVAGNGAQWPTIPSSRITVSGNIVGSGTYQTHGIHVANSTTVNLVGNDCTLSGSTADFSVDLSDENGYTAKNNAVYSAPTSMITEVLEFPDGADTVTLTGTAVDITTISPAHTTTPQRYQELKVYNTVPVTYTHAAVGGNLRLSGDVDAVLPAGAIITFIHTAGTWREVSRT